MDSDELVYTDCELMFAIGVATQFNRDYSYWIAGELTKDRTLYGCPTDDDGEPLDVFDSSAVDALVLRLTEMGQHVLRTTSDPKQLAELIEILTSTLALMKKHRSERTRKGHIDLAWSVALSQVSRAADALKRTTITYCSHTPASESESEAAEEPQSEAGGESPESGSES